MTAVIFPLCLRGVAFAICGRRWQNDEYENKVWWCEAYYCENVVTFLTSKLSFSSGILVEQVK